MIDTKPTKLQAPPDDVPHRHGEEFVGSAEFIYCKNCQKYHPREHFVERPGTTAIVCRRCHEELIGVDHSKRVQAWLRKIVTYFIDQEIETKADAQSISSLAFAKSFYNQFGGPAEAGAEIGSYFKDLMREHPASIGAAGKLVTLMRLMVSIEAQHQPKDELPTTKEGLTAHMQTLAMKAVNQAMRTEAAKNLAQAAEFLSDNMPIAKLSEAFEQVADGVAQDRGLLNEIGALDAKPIAKE